MYEKKAAIEISASPVGSDMCIRDRYQTQVSDASIRRKYQTQVSYLLYTSYAADELLCVDLGGRRIIKKKNVWQTIQLHTPLLS